MFSKELHLNTSTTLPLADTGTRGNWLNRAGHIVRADEKKPEFPPAQVMQAALAAAAILNDQQ
ncbi:hypothetical protein DIT71_03385 [Marinobacter vulgaris]|uniref:Uncharacterized protein n=1 Tax=Marinobacter vulgaris TaxID=1928331 RepID=A0A2V3ZMU5_9GAMM|nr:hypothetical protein DIT71_03385 [Marinobacter vulgaris]